jgi:hypothetical protein
MKNEKLKMQSNGTAAMEKIKWSTDSAFN